MKLQRASDASSRTARRIGTPWVAVLALAALGRQAVAADDVSGNGNGEPNAVGCLVNDWFATSDTAKESQPHWMTPVVTVTPRLEQEYRYDQSWQSRPGSVNFDSYGGGKGLELIPSGNTELIIGQPAYQTRDNPKGSVSGWADETMLLKYRAAAGNEENGNYIVTGFLGVSVPTGSAVFTNDHTIVTPTIAVGKGWGSRESGFDIQSTLGISVPTGDKHKLGEPTVWNTALQAHVLEKLWPEIEASYTYFKDGPNDGKSQTALTAGLVLGRFELTERMKLIIGGGYQKAISSFHTFDHAWLLTARVAF